MTSKRVVTKAAEAVVRFVANGANPVKIGGSVAEVHLREYPSFLIVFWALSGRRRSFVKDEIQSFVKL